MSQKQVTTTSEMFLLQKRLDTFLDWPFTTDSGASCTAERMAQTGFFRPNPSNEPDLARCFMCQKELEGWEDIDDPETEHANHSANCPFLSFKVRDVMSMTMKEFFKLVCLKQFQEVEHREQILKKEMLKLCEDFKKELC